MRERECETERKIDREREREREKERVKRRNAACDATRHTTQGSARDMSTKI